MFSNVPVQDSWVAAVLMAATAGAIFHFCSNRPIDSHVFIREVMASGLCGVMSLLLCEWRGIEPPERYLVILCAGMMGIRLLKEAITLVRIRMGLEKEAPLLEAAAEADVKH